MGAEIDECVQLYTLSWTIGTSRVLCHTALAHIIKVRSVKGIETISVQKQLSQLSNKTLYSMSLCCPSLNTLAATLKWKKGKKKGAVTPFIFSV